MSKTRLTKSCVLLLSASVLGAVSSRQGRADETESPTTTEKAPTKDTSPSGKFASQIDAYINKRLDKEKLTAAPQSEDAEFLRRAWLDICGAAPDPTETMSFLADRDPDKRRKKVDELIAKPDMARNWAEFWTDVMEGEATTKRREDQLKTDFRTWFEGQLKQNVPFDELTRRVVDAEGYVQDNGAVGYLLSYTDMGNQPDPKTLAATTARVFMGLQIECAQCHDHPFADWKRQQFMELSAFFARARRDQVRLDPPMSKKELAKLPEEERVKLQREFQKKQQMQPFGIKEADKGEFMAEVQTVRNPGEKDGKVPPPPATAQKMAATPPKKPAAKQAKPPVPPVPGAAAEAPILKYLVVPQFMVPALAIKPEDTQTKRRDTLGKLITSEKNPFYSKNCANRIWGRLTGRPLVAPSEDMSDANAPHDPELLTLLAKGFRDLKYDHKQFVRAICLTDAYGRSSRTTVDRDDRTEYQKLVHLEQLYGQGVVRPIDARPLARTMIAATTLGAASFDDLQAGRQAQGLLVRFERLFGESNMDPKKYEETIPQALFLINGQGTNKGGNGGGGKKGALKEGKALTPPPSAAVATLLTRFDDPRERVTRLYLAALCRPPKKAEIDDALAYVKESGGEGDAYEDVLWALVNSAEFRFNR